MFKPLIERAADAAIRIINERRGLGMALIIVPVEQDGGEINWVTTLDNESLVKMLKTVIETIEKKVN